MSSQWQVHRAAAASAEEAETDAPTGAPRRWLRIVVVVVVVLALVAAGVVVYQTLLRPRPQVSDDIVQAAVGEDMQVVVFRLGREVAVVDATLFLTNGETIDTATPPGRARTVAFFVSQAGEMTNIERVEIETMSGQTIVLQSD